MALNSCLSPFFELYRTFSPMYYLLFLLLLFDNQIGFGQNNISSPVMAAQSGCIDGNCRDGFGRYAWHGGEYYIGEWQNHRMHGYGVFYWPSGKKYVGEWVHGKFNGSGTMFYPDGERKAGQWENNKLIQLRREAYSLSEKNIRHGEAQLRQMRIDRPAMQRMVRPGDTIWNWVVLRLAGKDIRSTIYWQAESSEDFPIPKGVNAAHGYPTPAHNGRIWLHPSTEAEELWSGLIFELHNIRNYKQFNRVRLDAVRGNCDRDVYIMRHAELEYQAVQATARFYEEVWKPYCQARNIPTDPKRWFTYVPDSFEAWISLYTDSRGYPWSPYGEYYDALLREALRQY